MICLFSYSDEKKLEQLISRIDYQERIYLLKNQELVRRIEELEELVKTPD